MKLYRVVTTRGIAYLISDSAKAAVRAIRARGFELHAPDAERYAVFECLEGFNHLSGYEDLGTYLHRPRTAAELQAIVEALED